MSQAITPDRICEVAFSFAASKVLLTAVEMGLFTHLGEGPQDLPTLMRRLELHPRSAADFLDTLVALGMLEREEGRYRNTAETSRFLDRNSREYIGGMLEMSSRRLYRFWHNLPEGLRTGEPQNELRDEPDLFTRLYADPHKLQEFLAAMTGLSRPAARAIGEKFDWKSRRTFIDVGCAQGGLPVEIAKMHPHLTGGGYDLPQVRPVFEEYVRRNELADRLTFHPGDMFKEPLPTADVLVMGHILHDWGLEAKKELCRKAYEALPPGGAFIVYDAMIDDERRKNVGGLLMSLNMLIETRDGFDYTGADCKAWLQEAGFCDIRQEYLNGPDSMVIGIK